MRSFDCHRISFRLTASVHQRPVHDRDSGRLVQRMLDRESEGWPSRRTDVPINHRRLNRVFVSLKIAEPPDVARWLDSARVDCMLLH